MICISLSVVEITVVFFFFFITSFSPFQMKDKDVRVYDSSTLKLKLTFGGTGHLDVTE